MRKKLIAVIVFLSVLLVLAIGAVIVLESRRNNPGSDEGTGTSLVLETEFADDQKTPEVTFSQEDKNNSGQNGSQNSGSQQTPEQDATRDPDENALPEQPL